MNYLLISSMVMMAVGVILTLVSFSVAEKMFFDREKSSPFECGFDPLGSSRIPFSLRFFIIAVIFLVFDVEIVLLLPLSSTWGLSNLSYWSFTFLIFLIVLLLGTMYEWGLGALFWKN